MLKTFIHHPQRVWVRRMLFQIHLWAGILVALYLFIVGTTGSLLVFEDEFTRLTLPHVEQVAPPSQPPSLERIIDSSQRSVPTGRAFFLSFPEPGENLYRVWLRTTSGQQVIRIADGVTGSLFPDQGRSWIEWVHDLHVYLLLGPSGLIVNGIGATALLLLACTGVVLWWPGIARWVRALGVRTRGNWRRINFDLHSAIGFWTLMIVFWWAVSGIYFAWPTSVAKAVGAFSQLKGMRPPSVPAETRVSRQSVPLEFMVRSALGATPGGTVSGIALPTTPTGNVIVYIDRRVPGDFSHRDIHYFGTSSGQLLATWHYGENQTAGDWILWAMHPLHFGTLWGLGPKILWALLGMSLPVLSVTGLLMYWNRRLRFLVHRRRSA